jgi:hypothetical protein
MLHHPPFSLLLLGCLTAAVISGCHSDADHYRPAPASFARPVCINGRCGVVDQNAKQIVPFESGYRAIFVAPDQQTALAAKEDGWVLLDLATQAVKQRLAIDGDIDPLATPGLVAFQRGGKWGVMDFSGKERQPPRFDEINPIPLGDAVVRYKIGDKSGLLDASGKVLTEALYDGDMNAILDDTGSSTGLVLAQRDAQSYLIHLKDGEQQAVPYSTVDWAGDQHFIASSGDGGSTRYGLLDAKGSIVIDIKYRQLGTLSEGLIAFWDTLDGPCGYLDYRGRVVISARFKGCSTFGKRGALVADSTSGKWGFIDRSGHWLQSPSYDYAGGPVVFSTVSWIADDNMQRVSETSLDQRFPAHALQGLRTIANFANGRANPTQRHALARLMDLADMYYATVIDNDPNGVLTADVRVGIFDADRGREVLPPSQLAIGALSPGRFVFTGKRDETIDSHALVGVMDDRGNVLIKPGRFYGFRMSQSGHYLLSERDESEDHFASLYDKDGHLLVASSNKALVIDEAHGIALGYATSFDTGLDSDDVYDLSGRPLLSIKSTPCGARQLLDGAGKPIWPVDPTPYCQQ